METEISFTRPSETVTETPVVETPAVVAEPIIDPATGEPTLAKDDAVVAPVVEAPKVDEPAIRKLAIASREARVAREENAKLLAELAETKAKLTAPAATNDAQAELDAIKKDPSLLFKHGWDADKLLKRVLEPESPTETDPVVADLLKRVKEGEERAAKAEVEQKKASDAAKEAEINAKVGEATERVSKYIESKKEEFFLCDADDASSITKSVMKQLDTWVEEDKAKGKVYEPTAEDARNLIDQALKQRHDKRHKRFGSRLVSTPVVADDSTAVNKAAPLRDIPFTDGVRSTKPRDLKTTDPKPKVKSPPTTGEPLPAKASSFELGFTKN